MVNSKASFSVIQNARNVILKWRDAKVVCALWIWNMVSATIDIREPERFNPRSVVFQVHFLSIGHRIIEVGYPRLIEWLHLVGTIEPQAEANVAFVQVLANRIVIFEVLWLSLDEHPNQVIFGGLCLEPSRKMLLEELVRARDFQ